MKSLKDIKSIYLFIVSSVLLVLCLFADMKITAEDYNSRSNEIQRKRNRAAAVTAEYPVSTAENENADQAPAYDCDFKNLVDCKEYFSAFSEAPRISDDSHEGTLVSHNQVYLPTGDLCTVNVIAVDQPLAENNSDSGYFGWMTVRAGDTGPFSSLAYSSQQRHGLVYTFEEHFPILFEDYDNNGYPDFVLRACDKEGDGAYYVNNRLAGRGYVQFPDYTVPHCRGNADSTFYVYGATEPSIRFDRIDGETFFLMTQDEDGTIYPVIMGPDFREKKDIYSVDGKLFSLFYEDGELRIKCTDTQGKEGIKCSPGLAFYRLEDRMWVRTDIAGSAAFCTDRLGKDTVSIPVQLEKGSYRMEISLGEKGIASAELTVR